MHAPPRRTSAPGTQSARPSPSRAVEGRSQSSSSRGSAPPYEAAHIIALAHAGRRGLHRTGHRRMGLWRGSGWAARAHTCGRRLWRLSCARWRSPSCLPIKTPHCVVGSVLHRAGDPGALRMASVAPAHCCLFSAHHENCLDGPARTTRWLVEALDIEGLSE